jgi:predicted dienelactone hydrolase
MLSRAIFMTCFVANLRAAGRVVALLLSLSGAASAQAVQPGWQPFTVAGGEPITVALFYPTSAPVRSIPMGPWTVQVAPRAPADQALKGLIVLSHGTGGSEIGHHELATRLAAAGYLVAALRHPHDNWQDQSLRGTARYFTERPAQASRVIDAVLADPAWSKLLPTGRIGAVGHSARGFTVLALGGAQALPQRAAAHCSAVQDDPGFCALAKRPDAAQSSAPQPERATTAHDARVRAVVALAPLAMVFSETSLASIQVPTRIYVAGQDAVLAGRYHGGYAAKHMAGAQYVVVPEAGHFAFMSKPQYSLPSAAGDPFEDPQGFDRAAFQQRLAQEIIVFFDSQLRQLRPIAT